MSEKIEYLITVTDTFGDEANFSWVNKYTTKAKNFRGAMLKLARYTGRKGAICNYTYGQDEVRYDYRNVAICVFIKAVDEHDDVNGVKEI